VPASATHLACYLQAMLDLVVFILVVGILEQATQALQLILAISMLAAFQSAMLASDTQAT
jgi:hypothetical protein